MDPVLALLALALGFKHSYDADHLVAVGNIIARSPGPRRTAFLSAAWAVGHMGTAGAVTLLLFALRDLLLRVFLANLDWMVASMLITVGGAGILWELGILRYHRHPHAHGGWVHSHGHLHLAWFRSRGDHGTMLGIGFVHGLASNDELLVLLTAYLGISTLAGMLLGLLIFSLGVAGGMLLFGLGLLYPIHRWGRGPVGRAVNVAVGAVSLVYGACLLLGLEDLNLLPLPLPR